MNTPNQRVAQPIDTVTFLGLTIQPRSMRKTNKVLDEWIRKHRKSLFQTTIYRSVYLFQQRAKVREFCGAESQISNGTGF
jgi:hypothetical protein